MTLDEATAAVPNCGLGTLEVQGEDQHDLYFSAAWQVLEERDGDGEKWKRCQDPFLRQPRFLAAPPAPPREMNPGRS